MVDTNRTNLPLNYTDSGYEDSQEDRQNECILLYYDVLILAGVFIFISLCGLVGNMVVMQFLCFHMKRNPFTVYVLNLAIADFSLLLSLLVIFPLYIILAVNCFLPHKHILILLLLNILFLFWYLASMYLLTAMSIERCLSVLLPIWYRCHRPKHLSGIMCGMLWVLAALTASFTFISCILPFLHYESIVPLVLECDKVLEGLSTVNFLIFCLFPLLSNFSLFIRLRCGSQRHPGKLYVAVLLSVIFMFIFGLPLTVIFLHDFVTPLFPVYIGYLLASLNSSINPVIYVLMGSCRKRQLQVSMKVALRRVFDENVTHKERSHVPVETPVETTV